MSPHAPRHPWLVLLLAGLACHGCFALILGPGAGEQALDADGAVLLQDRSLASRSDSRLLGQAGPYALRLSNVHNMQYHGDLMVGGQALKALYDTGSFDIVALSTLCKTCTEAPVVYDSSKSSTFRQGSGPGPVTQTFGSGSIEAEQDLEAVRVGGADSPVKVKDMPFWQVIKHTMRFWRSKKGGQFSTIVGLCHPAKVPSEFALGNARDTLLDRLGVDRFAFCFAREGSTDGWLILDVQEDSLRGEAFTAVPLVLQNYWAVELTGVSLGTASLDACRPACAALVDSGSSFILVPPSVMTALENALATTPRSTSDCSMVSNLPDLEFELGGRRFTIPPEAYMVEDNRWGPMLTSCVPAVAAVDRRSSKGPLWSLGLPFLRYYYTVFDRAGASLHIAASDPACSGHGAAPAPAESPAAFAARAPSRLALHARAPGLAGRGGRRSAPVRVDLSAARLPLWAVNSSTLMIL